MMAGTAIRVTDAIITDMATRIPGIRTTTIDMVATATTGGTTGPTIDRRMSTRTRTSFRRSASV